MNLRIGFIEGNPFSSEFVTFLFVTRGDHGWTRSKKTEPKTSFFVTEDDSEEEDDSEGRQKR